MRELLNIFNSSIVKRFLSTQRRLDERQACPDGVGLPGGCQGELSEATSPPKPTARTATGILSRMCPRTYTEHLNVLVGCPLALRQPVRLLDAS